MKNARYVLLAVWCFSLLGCGTVNTVLHGDEVTRRNLKQEKTYCEAIPRVYSGVSYDLCILNGPPQDTGLVTLGFVPLQILDFIPSVILDTLALPYTIYRQSEEGNIEIRG